MATSPSYDRSASARRVCFRNPFKRLPAKNLENPISDLGQRKISSESNNSIPTDCSLSGRHNDCCCNDNIGFIPINYVLPKETQQTRRFHCFENTNNEDEGDSSTFDDSRRSSSLFRCFGTRSICNTTNNRRPHTAREIRRSKKTSRYIEDTACSNDPSDSIPTTRSTSIDQCDDSTSVTQLRSRGCSFYSAVSHYDENEGSSLSCSTVKLKLGRSLSKTFQSPATSTGDSLDDFFSVCEDDWNTNDYSEQVLLTESTSLKKERELHHGEVSLVVERLCACGFTGHGSIYNPEFPLIIGPGIAPDSYEEMKAIALSCCGCWDTIVERSESLDSQYRCIGLGMVKRAVLNRLAIPLTMFLEDNDTVLHCWIHTPLGIRHMRSNLLHKMSVDDDPDAGTWTGVSHVVDYSIPWYCNGKTVRAIQQRRENPKIGISIETRCILPDNAEGKIMLFNFMMIPKGKTNKFSADRILKYAGPKTDELSKSNIKSQR